ncbi:hypothetical protein NC652_019191 [Populus alba x Populus x berolinensis]|nr:hypothetical protein NC652_019191 [Populus alba x Populus x berolinensis]
MKHLHEYISYFDVSGIVPPTTIQLDIYWKEMDGDNEWVARANDLDDGVEEGHESLRDEISSVSSYQSQ